MFQARKRKTGFSLILSLIVNAVVILLLLGGAAGVMYQHQAQKKQQLEAQPNIVQAVAVNQADVEKQIHAIKAQRQAEKQAQINWKNQLQKQAQQAKSSLSQTKAQQAQANANLARLALLKQKAESALNALKSQSAALSKNKALVEQELSATQAQLKQSLSQAERAKLEAKLYEEQAKKRALEQQKFDNQIAKFKTLIENAVERQWLLPPNAKKTMSCTLALTLDPYGKVQSVKITQSSGDPVLDRSAVTAVLKASPLPVPSSPILLKEFRTITITLKPEGVVGA